MSDTDVYEWETECWKCGEQTSVIWPKNADLDSEVGEELAELEDNAVERVYSNSLSREVWGNVCEACDAYQGNHFLEEEVIEQFAPPIDCPQCGGEHEWYPDDGMGGAFGQGWIDCPEYGPIPKGKPDF